MQTEEERKKRISESCKQGWHGWSSECDIRDFEDDGSKYLEITAHCRYCDAEPTTTAEIYEEYEDKDGGGQ